MRLTDRKVNKIVIDVTSEMRQRIQELNQSVADDMKKIGNISTQSMELQVESMRIAMAFGI